jgi:hypothetical protein
MPLVTRAVPTELRKVKRWTVHAGVGRELGRAAAIG